jgi:hypothetical protein
MLTEQFHGSAPVTCLRNHLHTRLPIKQRRQSFPHQQMIVGNQDANHLDLPPFSVPIIM